MTSLDEEDIWRDVCDISNGIERKTHSRTAGLLECIRKGSKSVVNKLESHLVTVKLRSHLKSTLHSIDADEDDYCCCAAACLLHGSSPHVQNSFDADVGFIYRSVRDYLQEEASKHVRLANTRQTALTRVGLWQSPR